MRPVNNEPSLQELAVLFDEFAREFAETTDTRRRKEIAAEISELTLFSSLKDRSKQKS
jgi:hypothetical protein